MSKPDSNTFFVKEAKSGDTLTLVVPRSWPPQEKQVSLANIDVPRMARKGFVPRDEPYAFDAREYVRKRVVGKMVTFELEYNAGQANREFGQVFIEGKCLAQELLEEGLATVRPSRGPSGDNTIVEAFKQTEELARQLKKGKYSDDEEHTHVRDLKWEPNNNDEKEALFTKLQGKNVKAIVEQVMTACQLRLYLPELQQMCLLAFLGVQMPDKEGENKIIPLSEQSKFGVEQALLQREVTVKIESCVQTGILLLGCVVAGEKCYSAEILGKGWVQLHNPSVSRSVFAAQLRAAQEAAVTNKIGIWKSRTPAPIAVTASQNQPTRTQLTPEEQAPFKADVFHVISGDTLELACDNGSVLKVSLSHTKAPKPAFDRSASATKTSEYPEWSWEAREFIRQRLIGQTVTVYPAYRRPIGNVFDDERKPITKEDKKKYAQELEKLEHRLCVRIEYGPDSKNVAAELMEAGYASVPSTRGDDPDLDVLLKAQTVGATAKRPAASTTTFQDLFRPGQKKAQQYLTFLRGYGSVAPKHRCIIEQVISASRFRVCVLGQACIITIVIQGLNAPSNGRKDNEGRIIEDPQPFGLESTDFAKRHFWQRDGEVEVESIDPNGVFHGALTVDKELVGVTLLKNGMVTLNTNADRVGKHNSEYRQAESYGIKNGLGLFSLPEEARPGEYMSKAKKRSMGNTGGRLAFDPDQTPVPCMVTEVTGTTVWAQLLTENNKQTLRSVETMLNSLQLNTGAHKQGIKADDLVVGKFTADNLLYRAKVQRLVNKGEKYTVTYIDYGNTETLPKDRVWKVDEVTNDFAKHPPLAVPLSLAFLAECGEDEQRDVCSMIRDYVHTTGALIAQTMYKEEGKRGTYVVIKPANGQGDSMQGMLLREGACRLRHRFLRNGTVEKGYGPAYTKLRPHLNSLFEAENEAKKNHRYIWTHGDCFESDEE